jgi:hypothetical protein
MADHYGGRIWPGQPDEDGGDIFLWAGAEEAFFGSVGGEDFPAEVTHANARRLAAAWNATLGLPVEALEAGVVGRMLAMLRRVRETCHMSEDDSLGPDIDRLIAEAGGEPWAGIPEEG